ncbi:MAG: hypothetical protein J6Z14_10675 [Prevotella sp.]|nr:hypothetical protein [Prevotella sp.]
MKKYYFIAALAALALASCTNDDFIGDNSPNAVENVDNGAIKFGFSMQNVTRADIAGSEAAKLLGYNFYVAGTKGTEPETSPTKQVVFDNYLVHYEANSAGTQDDNTANWEYVGVVPGTAPTENYVKLSPAAVTAQTIKFWDYSQAQYDFLAFSTGTFKAVDGTSADDDEIGVTAMKYGAGLTTPPAYTFDLPSVSALENTFITDITEVKKENYGKEVTLKFKNLGAKVRVALYETVPGYSVKAESVKFYTEDGTTDFNDDKGVAAALISANTSSFASKGQVAVSFPNIGTDNESNNNYNKAAVNVTATGGDTKKTFGELASEKFKTAEGSETAGAKYLGRTLPDATFAGNAYYNYYTSVFPVSTGSPLTLRVDYTLVSTDGSGEEIEVLGAKAVVPSTYTEWQPNYAYTYIFKISDNTNGWTDPDGVTAGLFPITFDAVVAAFTDANAEQTTVTTVAAPSITTYQQSHAYTTNEYSKTATGPRTPATIKDVYVQVMKDGALVTDLNSQDGSSKYDKSFLFKLSKATATEAEVMDALEKRAAQIGTPEDDVTGRNGLGLTNEYANLDNTVDEIVNGVDDNPIDLETTGGGKAAKLDMTNLTAGTYAYVYDWTTGAKTEIKEFQPVATDPTTRKFTTAGTYYTVATSVIDGAATSTTAADEAVNHANLYFTRTLNSDGITYTYSYVSVAGKSTLPAGLIKIAKTSVTTTQAVTTSDSPAANTFYFDTYFSNDGKYAVKVIKIVA